MKAHSMRVTPLSSAAKPTKTPAADEMKAHSMDDERPTLERVTHRVVYDPVKEEYRPIP
jgi:hypothetical protein